MAGAKVFSKLDCNSGFHQIKLSEDSTLLTTFTTPFGRFAYKRLPFGISSASEIFQKKIHAILEGLNGVLCLIDDVVVFGRTQEEHDLRLHAVLERFRQAHVTVNDKCVFNKHCIKFAGHIISGDGVSPDLERLAAVRKMAPPTTVTEMKCFLGMVNQLAKFSSSIAQLAEPLHDLIRSNRTWVWDAVQQKAFDDVKQAITSAPTLALYDMAKPTIVSADSSSYGLGAVLKQQQEDSTWRPVVFASRTLTDTERRYAQVEKECLALMWACEKFEDYLVGAQRFVLHTDHKPLVSLLSPERALDDLPPRIQRFRIRLSRRRFNYMVEYVPGNQLGTADTLSRFPLATHHTTLNDECDVIDTEQYVCAIVDSLPISDVMHTKVREALASDDILQRVISYTTNGWPDDVTTPSTELASYWHSRDQLTVHDGLLLYSARIVIPVALRSTTLEALHTGHLGVEKCRAKARASVWWPKIGDDIQRIVSTCQTCQHYARDRYEPLLSTPLPDLPWQKVATDLFELYGKHYLVVVDYYSRYFELAEIRHQTADDVITTMKSFFARHGVPMIVHSDNGPCYASAQFSTFATKWGFTHTTSSPRYPQANGAAERAVQTAKNLLRKADDPYMALLSYRTTPLVNGYSPAQLNMGRQLRSTVPVTSAALKPRTPNAAQLRHSDREEKEKQAANYNTRHRARDHAPWHVDDRVWVPDLHSEATVTKTLPYRCYELRTAANNIIRRNSRSLRPLLPIKEQQQAPQPSPTAAPPRARCRVPETGAHVPQPVAPTPPRVLPTSPTPPAVPHVTRSGRIVKPPKHWAS